MLGSCKILLLALALALQALRTRTAWPLLLTHHSRMETQVAGPACIATKQWQHNDSTCMPTLTLGRCNRGRRLAGGCGIRQR